jgi:hypothetical protein
MNEWLIGHGIGKRRVPAISGGTILLGSSKVGENKWKRYVTEEFYEETGGKE